MESQQAKEITRLHPLKGDMTDLALYVLSAKPVPEIPSKPIKTICLGKRGAGKPLTLLTF